VSARDGLAAKVANDPDALRESGMPALEERLIRFLINGRRQAFLSSFCERMLLVTRRYPDDAAAATVALQVQAFQRHLASESGGAPVRQSLVAEWLGSLHELDPCEICAHIQSVSFDFLCRYQYDLSFDAKAQERHAQSRGLCAIHTRQLAALAAPRGIAIGYPALLDALSATLTHAAHAATAGVRPALAREDVLPDVHDRILCRVCAEASREAIGAIWSRLQRDNQTALSGLSAICMLHLPELAANIDDPALAAAVLTREASILCKRGSSNVLTGDRDLQTAVRI
jgi:hypothetical protein